MAARVCNECVTNGRRCRINCSLASASPCSNSTIAAARIAPRHSKIRCSAVSVASKSRTNSPESLFQSSKHGSDPQRIGVIGHSYGGFMTLMLLARNADDIRAGVSTAPVTDWSLYDTHYTERYLGTPQHNPDGYRSESCSMSMRIRGALLLMHGMADDNVLFANSPSLMKALQTRRFPFELMLYPGVEARAAGTRHVAIHRYRYDSGFSKRTLIS